MKTIINILTLLIFFTFLSCGQKTKEKQSEKIKKQSKVVVASFDTIDSHDFSLKNFKPLPKEYHHKDRAYLIEKIIPNTNYLYWECVFKDFDNEYERGHVIVYNGDKLLYSKIAKTINSNFGFFIECHPGACFTYIVGVRANKTVDTIDSEDKLKKFIGYIDNIEEVILSVKLNGYWFDSDTIVGGAYKERKNDYLLYLLDYSSTPVTYKSVKAILNKNGAFKVYDKTIYRQTEDYIME